MKRSKILELAGLVVVVLLAYAAYRLLGTVIGILKVFNVITAMGVGQATRMSAGISEALITTIVGLFIGIPAVVVYNFFTNKAERLILEIEKYSALLLRKVTSFQIHPQGGANPDAV